MPREVALNKGKKMKKEKKKERKQRDYLPSWASGKTAGQPPPGNKPAGPDSTKAGVLVLHA